MIGAPVNSLNANLAYLAAVARHWKLILGAVVLAALAAAVGTLLAGRLAPRYESQAEVIVTGAKYQLNFDPTFKTVDSITGGTDARVTMPLAARADEFRAIALSPEVQRAAAERLRAAAPPGEGGGVRLTELSDVKIRGGLISLTASADDPTTAAQNATAYAEAVTARLNDVYGQTLEDRAALEREQAEARAAYEDAEAQLIAFQRENRIDELNRQIELKEALQAKLQTLSKEQSTLAVERLRDYTLALADADQLSRDTQALRQQVETSGQSPAGLAAQAMSLMALQTRLVTLGTRTQTEEVPAAPVSEFTVDKEGKTTVTSSGGSGSTSSGGRSANTSTGASGALGLPTQLQFNADTLTQGADRQQVLGDVDALLAGIEARRSDFLAASEELTQQVVQGSPGTVLGQAPGQTQIAQTADQLTNEIQALRADLREETFRRDLLTQNLDRAKTTRNTLETKVQEADIAYATAGGTATLAASAVVPGRPSFPPALSRSVLLGALAGLIIGLGAAVALELWTRRPLAMPVPVQRPMATSAGAD